MGDLRKMLSSYSYVISNVHIVFGESIPLIEIFLRFNFSIAIHECYVDPSQPFINIIEENDLNEVDHLILFKTIQMI